MDLGRILDGTPEPSLTVADSILLSTPGHSNLTGDYVLPVPMTALQKELTEQVISSHYSDILKFFETSGPVMVESLNTLYVNAQLVATHPFLLVDHYLPKNLLLKEVPFRLQQASGKFNVLGDILEIIKSARMTVALVSRPGKSLDLIEAFILGKFVNYKRHSGSHLREPGEIDPEYSTLHLIPSSELDSTYLGDEKFDLIIALDQTFSEVDSHIKSIRARNRASNTVPTPILRLVPCNSIEHVYLKTKPAHYSDTEGSFLRRALAAAVVLRGKVGSLPSDLRSIYSQNLKPLSSWFLAPGTPWLLPDIANIPLFSASDVEKSLLTEFDSHYTVATGSLMGTAQSGLPPAFPRLTSSSHGGSDLEGTPVHQTTPSSDSLYYSAKRIKRETDVVPFDSSSLSLSYDPHSRSQALLTHALLQRMESIVNDNVRLVAEIQTYRVMESDRQANFEDITEEMAENVQRIAELEGTSKAAIRKAERCAADVERSNDRLVSMQQELEVTRQLLKEQGPEKETLDAQRRRIQQLEEDVQKTEEKLEARNSDNDYMLAQYQKASAAAVDAHAQLAEVNKDKQQLEQKLAAEMVQLRAMTFDQERQQFKETISELNAKVSMLEEHLKRVINADKDSRPAGRSRLTSRASSVPRRTKSPNPNSGVSSPSVSGDAITHPLQRSMNI